MNLLNEREKTHGAFEFVAAMTKSLHGVTEIYSVEMPAVHEQALHMIFVKIARLVNGDHNEVDHWQDISGYAQLVVNHIKRQVPPGNKTKETPDEPQDPSIGDDWDYAPKPLDGLKRYNGDFATRKHVPR